MSHLQHDTMSQLQHDRPPHPPLPPHDEDDADEVPETPPTEPPPVPIQDPRPEGNPPGPYVTR